MTSRKSSQSPPRTSSNATHTRGPSRRRPPSLPYLHLSESDILHRVDISTRTPTFTQIHIPRHLNSTFEIGNVVIF